MGAKVALSRRPVFGAGPTSLSVLMTAAPLPGSEPTASRRLPSRTSPEGLSWARWARWPRAERRQQRALEDSVRESVCVSVRACVCLCA